VPFDAYFGAELKPTEAIHFAISNLDSEAKVDNFANRHLLLMDSLSESDLIKGLAAEAKDDRLPLSAPTAPDL
jgi:hypothetical protein